MATNTVSVPQYVRRPYPPEPFPDHDSYGSHRFGKAEAPREIVFKARTKRHLDSLRDLIEDTEVFIGQVLRHLDLPHEKVIEGQKIIKQELISRWVRGKLYDILYSDEIRNPSEVEEECHNFFFEKFGLLLEGSR